jgi:hypothetical protein
LITGIWSLVDLRPYARDRFRLAFGLGLLMVALGGCSKPAPPVPVPTFPSSTSASATVTTSARPTLPGDCASLLSSQNVDLALGAPLVGRVRGVIGVPEPKINRLERVTCQYGLPDATPVPGQPAAPVPLEVSVSRYSDEASATERVGDTVESERARGAAPTTVPVGPTTGTVLVTPDRRLLVASSGPITVAITLAPGLADDRIAEVLADLGGQVLTAVT